jgi:hypothetical protein
MIQFITSGIVLTFPFSASETEMSWHEATNGLMDLGSMLFNIFGAKS